MNIRIITIIAIFSLLTEQIEARYTDLAIVTKQTLRPLSVAVALKAPPVNLIT